jgi:HAD superfamily hydrolase (TIGR01450 family)
VIARHFAARIESARAFVIDLDGTIALGDGTGGGYDPLPGAAKLLAELRGHGVPFRIVTNNSARSPAVYARALRAIGLDVRDNEILTPSSVAADFCRRTGLNRVRVLGTAGAAAPFAAAGLKVIDPSTPAKKVDAVYTGWFREMSFPDIEAASNDLWNGAPLLTASDFPFFATKEGKGLGTSFPLNAMFKALTGAEPNLLGKPSIEMLRFALKVMDFHEEATDRLVVMGDNPATDIAMARAGRALAIGVPTGLTSIEQWEALAEEERPDLVLDDFDPVIRIIRKRAVFS